MKAVDPVDIVTALNVTYTKQGVWVWMASPNRNLGNERPIDLLANGKQERVIREIERLLNA
ncbi:MAG TPA: MbcA/ParS/Xre antitoxin family protein [Pseudonocardia sp.]